MEGIDPKKTARVKEPETDIELVPAEREMTAFHAGEFYGYRRAIFDGVSIAIMAVIWFLFFRSFRD